MKKNTAQFLASAIVAGLLAGSATLSADHHEKKAAKGAKKDAKKMEAGKDGCKGKEGKDSCKAHEDHKDMPQTDEAKAQ